MECEVAADWVVDEKAFRDIKKYCSLKSPIFRTNIPGVHYSISVRPFAGENCNEVNICLSVKSATDVNADYTFSIPSVNLRETRSYFFEGEDDEDDGLYLPSELFFGCFRNGKLTLQLRGTFKCDEMGYQPTGVICYSNPDKDFTIQIGDKEIKVHKFILRARSPVFAAMFDSGMKEARENKVKIDGFPHGVIDEAVRFCYDRDHLFAFDFLSDDEKMLLLKFSDVYDIASLKIDVESNMFYSLTPDNVCKLANASIKFNSEKLHSRCINYLVKCIKDSTPVANFDILNAILKTELLNEVICHKI